MNTSLNFARRPFRDERPVFLVVGTALLAAAILFLANVRLYADFHRQMDGTNQQIEFLERRRAKAMHDAAEARTALNRYKVSTLAQESRGLLKLVGERRFSWTALLSRLESVLPEDVRVSRLSPRPDESGEVYLGLSLVGRNPESVVNTIRRLSSNAAFAGVELRSEASPEKGVPEGHSFELDVRYRSLGKQ